MQDNQLQLINSSLTTMKVADMIGKRHNHLLRDIDKYLEIINGNQMFIENTYKNRGRNYRCYNITLQGIKYLIDRKYKAKYLKPLIEWYDKNSTQENKIILADRFEDEFMDKLEQSLDASDITLQRQYIVGNYRIDGYIKELNIAVEYDEEQHNTLTNHKLDKARQKYISNKLKCKFVRCDYKDTDAYNIGKVFKVIMEIKKVC